MATGARGAAKSVALHSYMRRQVEVGLTRGESMVIKRLRRRHDKEDGRDTRMIGEKSASDLRHDLVPS